MNGCIYRNEFDVCKKYTTDKATSFCVGRNCPDRKESNADRIRVMTDEELASFLDEVSSVFCACVMDKSPCESDNCPCWLEWLQAESGGK